MSLFERIGVWLWTLGEGVQPAAPVISNYELVTAYEWLTAGGAISLPHCLSDALEEALLWEKHDICATLRKLGTA